MPEKYKIVIAEDHTILREGLRSLLESHDDMHVAGEAEDGLEAIRCVEKLSPDLLLLDLSMPRLNGISAVKEIKSRFPQTKILILTVHDSEDYLLEVFRAGAEGYCLKDVTGNELLMAIRSVLSGKRYLAPGIAGKVMEGYIEGKKSLKAHSAWDDLTQRERDVLKLVAEGRKNKEIADVLCISIKTVEKHRAHVMEKLGLHNAAALTAYAMEKGLISL